MNDASGAPIGYIAVTRDITQRKEIELALKESEAKYSTLVENSNDGIAVVQDLKVKFFNDIAYKKTGYNPQEVFDKPFLDFIPPQYRPMDCGTLPATDIRPAATAVV